MGELEEKRLNAAESEVPEKRDYEKELIAIIKSGEPPQIIRKKLEDYHENDIASVWEKLTKEERIKFYQLLGNETISEIFMSAVIWKNWDWKMRRIIWNRWMPTMR